MCGRFAYFGGGLFGYESLELPSPPTFQSYNISPTQYILSIRATIEAGRIEWAMLHWGLIPFWSKTPKTKYPLINARAEGIETKPSFRSPFRHRRCIIPASGFYEWRQMENGKQPYFIKPTHGEYFAFAGIWDHWEVLNGEAVDSCSIITTNANSIMATIHDRMPVILEEKDCLMWLDGGTGKEQLLKLLKPCPNDLIEAYPVTTHVNSSRNNDQE